MKVYLRANLIRTLTRPLFWIFVIFCQAVSILAYIAMINDTYGRPEIVFCTDLYNAQQVMFEVAFIALIFTILGPDMKARTMDVAIGRGISRNQVCQAKYFECLILMAIYLLVSVVFTVILSLVAGMDGYRIGRLIISLMIGIFELLFPLIFCIFAAVETQSVVVTLLAFLAVGMCVPEYIISALGKLPALSGLNITKYFPQEMFSSLSKYIIFAGKIKLSHLLLCIIYFVLAYIICTRIFKKRELDF